MITYNHFYFVTSFQRIWMTLLAILWANSRQFLHQVWGNFGMYLTTFLEPYQAHFDCNWWQFLLTFRTPFQDRFVRDFKTESKVDLTPNRPWIRTWILPWIEDWLDTQLSVNSSVNWTLTWHPIGRELKTNVAIPWHTTLSYCLDLHQDRSHHLPLIEIH